MLGKGQCSSEMTVAGLLGCSLCGICVIVISSMLLNQSVTLLIEQSLQREAFLHVRLHPFKNSNWMKSAVPLVVASILGLLIGTFQSISSLTSLILGYSKSAHLRRMGWLMWIAAGMCIFTLSCICFGLAVMLKAHTYRDPNDSVSFWTNYRLGKEVTHNFKGHAFCSALAINSAVLLGCMALVAGKIFHHHGKNPHLLLAL